MPSPALSPPPLTIRRPPWPRRLRILLWRLRVPFAAVCLGLAAVVAVQGLRPEPPVTVDVLVAARDLPAGATLTDDDVRVAALPAQAALPDARADGHAAVTGQRTAVPVPAGLPLVPGVLTGGRLTGPPGTVVTAVRLADAAVAGLLSPGDRVDVLAASAEGGPGTTVAARALVLPSPVSTPGGGLLSAGGGTSEPAPLLLAVAPEEAAALAGASGASSLSAVVVP